MYSRPVCAWSETRSVSRAPYKCRDERSRCDISSGCRRSSPRGACHRTPEGFCWQARISNSSGHSLAQIYGIPGIPEWADWFAEELKTHHAMSHILGIGCDPVMIKGTK